MLSGEFDLRRSSSQVNWFASFSVPPSFVRMTLCMELVDAAFGSLSAFGDTLAVLLKLIDVGSVEILSRSSVASSRSVIVVDAVGGREEPCAGDDVE